MTNQTNTLVFTVAKVRSFLKQEKYMRVKIDFFLVFLT